jgi:hypothetical protein
MSYFHQNVRSAPWWETQFTIFGQQAEEISPVKNVHSYH